MSRPSKTPPPDIYTEEYFLGSDEYPERDFCGDVKAFEEGRIEPRLEKALSFLQPRPSEFILDVGCGRGEIVKECTKKGCLAIGVDYSLAAVKISKHYSRAIILKASAADLPFREGMFDAVTLLDILHHLDVSDTNRCMKDVKRVLKRSGRILVHTPNKWYHCLQWLIVRPYNLFFKRNKLLSNSRVSQNGYYERVMWVNEQSPVSLNRLFYKHNLKIRRLMEKRSGNHGWKTFVDTLYHMFFADLWYLACKT